VIEGRERFRFTLEAVEELAIGSEGLEDHLEGDLAPELRVAGAIDLPHATSAKRAHDSVRTEIRSRVKGHSRMRCSGSSATCQSGMSAA
jgi:hypothetical protein